MSTLAKANPAYDSLSPEQKHLAIGLGLKLAALGISAHFEKCITGPVVESYYYRLAPTTPLAKVMGKSEDMALAVSRESAIITREKHLIAIQLPRLERQTVDFNNVLFGLAPQLVNSKLPILLGQASDGAFDYLDLAGEPHALIAGATGSGKSMFLTSAICTMAVTKDPSELKMVIVDSKQVDLAIFHGMPHVHSVCRGALDLHVALDYLTNEMRRRNSLMSGVARNIDEFNQVNIANGLARLPRIALIIDELADLLEEDYQNAKSKIEPFKSLPRLEDRLRSLAQLCRASGINIIAATQRPSVDIIPGSLKVNLPCRIAFRLPSIADSRTVLRESGAESLLGKGDMLVQSSQDSASRRSHAPFVELDSIAAIVMSSEGVRDTLRSVAAQSQT